MARNLLSLYFSMHLNLIIGFAVLWVFLKIAERFQSHVRFHFLLRAGQFLFLLSLILPLVVRQIPSGPVQKFLPLSYVSFPELPDWEASLQRKSQGQVSLEPTSQALDKDWRQLVSYENSKVILFCLLSLCVAFSLMRQLISYLSLIRMLRRSHEIKAIGRVIISVSEEISIPFSTRIDGKARVVFPLQLLSDRTDLRAVIRHELQHHRHFDVLWAIAMETIESFFSPNPFVRLWRTKLQEHQELACDEAVIERRKKTAMEYGKCLLHFAEKAVASRSLPKGITCMAQPLISRRIQMLYQHGLKSSRSRTAVFITVMANLILIFVSCAARQIASSPTGNEISSEVLALDKNIEKVAQTAIEEALKREGASSGFVVVADPSTGKILAAVGANTENKKVDSPSDILRKQIVPASSMKTFTAALAIEAKVVNAGNRFNCEKGEYKLQGRVYEDWRQFKELSVLDMVVHSSNICGIKIAQALGSEKLYLGLQDLGFGTEGVLPKPTKPDDVHFAAEVAVGHGGFLATPHEIVSAYSAIANEGLLANPVEKKSRRVFSKETARIIKGALIAVVEVGTAEPVKSTKYSFAGKTSTGYAPGNDKVSVYKANVAGFVGLAPAMNTRYVIQVMVEFPKGKSAHGSSHAGPVFKEIAEALLSAS
jgi:hypothetical protein